MLSETERARFATGIEPLEAVVARWKPHAPSGRTYARVDYRAGAPAFDSVAPRPDRIADPPLVVLEIIAERRPGHPRLVAALAGPAGLGGVLDARDCGDCVVVELDPRLTPLGLVVDVIDGELGDGAGRTITPLLGLDDDVLARFAGDALATPGIDSSRLVETYAEPLLRDATR